MRQSQSREGGITLLVQNLLRSWFVTDSGRLAHGQYITWSRNARNPGNHSCSPARSASSGGAGNAVSGVLVRTLKQTRSSRMVMRSLLTALTRHPKLLTGAKWIPRASTRWTKTPTRIPLNRGSISVWSITVISPTFPLHPSSCHVC